MGCPRPYFLGAVAIESNILLSTDKIEESYTQNIQQVPVAERRPRGVTCKPYCTTTISASGIAAIFRDKASTAASDLCSWSSSFVLAFFAGGRRKATSSNNRAVGRNSTVLPVRVFFTRTDT